jgi:hypothetical protein
MSWLRLVVIVCCCHERCHARPVAEGMIELPDVALLLEVGRFAGSRAALAERVPATDRASASIG